jgi:hypothetical protein
LKAKQTKENTSVFPGIVNIQSVIMPCQESIADAKATFVSAVSEGIFTLMHQCGYSRDRATSALMRELNRGGEHTRPSDEEIFDSMRRYNLGIEEATKTIIISRAMRRAMVDSKSPAEAIELLASKISLRNLLYDSSDEDPTSDDDLAIRPELRVKPVSNVDHQLSSRRKPTPVRKLSKAAIKTVRPRTKTPSKGSMAGRKRTIEEIAPVEKKDTSFQTRERSDSVTTEVDAKIAAKKSNEEGAGNESVIRPTANVRAKRVHRTDESESVTQTSIHKWS